MVLYGLISLRKLRFCLIPSFLLLRMDSKVRVWVDKRLKLLIGDWELMLFMLHGIGELNKK
jgi:hypothetical protein